MTATAVETRFDTFEARHRELQAEIWAIVEPQLNPMLDRFYTAVRDVPHLAKLVQGRYEHLKKAQGAHWRRLFTQGFDQAYAESIRRIGLAHARVGLDPGWYMSGYRMVTGEIIAMIAAKHRFRPRHMADLVDTLLRTVFVDMDHAISAYLQVIDERRVATLKAVQDGFGRVVAAAGEGDFTARVETAFDEPVLVSLGEGLNRLTTAVEEGLGTTARVLAALGSGDLTERVKGDYRGAFASLQEGVNRMADDLEGVLRGISVTVYNLQAAMSEMLTGADDLAQRTTQQAAALEETSAALEEFAGTSRANAARAKNGAEIAAAAQKKAQHGAGVMTDAQQAMERIQESSTRITDVIGVIEDMAFQTNLLALNASVEAARAGEAGRGFAVVAGEVRRLAQRAAQASNEVRKLVDTSRSEVKTGVGLVEKASNELTAIVGSVEHVTSLMLEISQASTAQAETVAEITIAVRRMDEMTQQNAALVEETNGAISATREQVQSLSDTVDRFELSDAGKPQRMPRARAA